MPASASDQEGLLGLLKRQADHLAIDSGKGVPLVRPGLITTLYFKLGHTPEIRGRIVDCFTRFYEAFRPVLQWQRSRHMRPLTPSTFAAGRRRALSMAADESFQWSLASRPESEVALYRLFVMSMAEGQAELDRSCLKMVLPWTFLCEPDGVQRYEQWIRYLCGQVRAEHGFGGLACILPCEGQHYLSLEYPLTCQYRGLMVDPCPQVESLRLLNHIKGVSWYTVLGTHFVRRLGGSDQLRRRLSPCRDIVFHSYGGGLIIRAGLAPQLLDQAQTLPAAYALINKSIKPVRLQDESCLHPYNAFGSGFSEPGVYDWYARFDEKPKPPLDGGSRCTHSGYWFSNAMAGSRRYFSKGEVMLAFDPARPERTRWFWSEQND